VIDASPLLVTRFHQEPCQFLLRHEWNCLAAPSSKENVGAPVRMYHALIDNLIIAWIKWTLQYRVRSERNRVSSIAPAPHYPGSK